MGLEKRKHTRYSNQKYFEIFTLLLKSNPEGFFGNVAETFYFYQILIPSDKSDDK